MRKSLTSTERLKKRSQFSQIFENSDFRQSCRGAKLVIKRNELLFNRFAALLVKKFGKAVQRNYARRVLKEIYRNNKHCIPLGYDIIVVLYPGEFSYHDRERQFTKMIRRIDFGSQVS